MQIERKPSRWPYVGALIGLLIFSLTVPRYWHTATDSFPGTLDPGDFEPIGDPGWGSWPSGPIAFENIDWPSLAQADAPTSLSAESMLPQFGIVRFDWTTLTLSDDTAPSIDELIAALGTRPYAAWYGDRTSNFDPLAEEYGCLGMPAFDGVGTSFGTASRTDARQVERQMPPPVHFATAMLYRVVRALAQYSWHDIADWIPRLVKLVRAWSGMEPFAEDGPVLEFDDRNWHVLVDSPNDRLAMLQPNNAPTSDAADRDDWRSAGRSVMTPCSTPDVLLEQLARLSQQPYSARWAEQTTTLVTAFTNEDRARPELTGVLLRRLKSSAEEADQLAAGARDETLRAELLRAHWALARRLDRWAVVNDIRIASVTRARVASRGTLTGIFDGPPQAAEVPVNIQSLSADLEIYESTRAPALARRITQSQRALQSSSAELERTLAGAVEQHYRNANVRIAVTADLLNRIVEDERAEAGTVHERIAGTPVRGASNTLSDSRIMLAPDTGRWRMELEAEGVVESQTTADGGMAQLYSHGATDFVARKSIVVDPSGVRMEPATVTTYNRNRLVGVTTDFDWVPLFGALARDQARQQYQAKRSRAKAEVEVKVATRAMKQLDEEAAKRVAKLEQDIRGRFAPFEEAGVTLTTVEMASTSERLVGRFRLAGDYQLGGHTPRPRALSDSLASVQLHETALTNAAAGLELDGKRYTAPELQAALREKFPRMSLEAPREAHDDTVFQFAYNDTISFHIADGKIELVLAIDDFQHEGRRVRGFIVHAFYVPVVSGLEVELAREGALGFEGRLSSADRARLHNVFKEVLSEERRLPLVQLENPDDARLADLMVTQLVLEDGWFGMAIGPEAGGRVAERTRSLR